MNKERRYLKIDKDLKKIKSHLVSPRRDLDRNKENEKNKFLLAFSYNIGYYLITPLILGVVVGLFFDNKFKTKPVLTLVFIFFGLIGSLYNLLRIVKENK